MALFDLFGKKPVLAQSNYSIDYSVHPLSLRPYKNDYLLLSVYLTNNSDQPMLTSLVAFTSKKLGFESNLLSNQKETRLGVLEPGEKRSIHLKVWSSPRTTPGGYPLFLTAVSHYRDYGHVLNESRKRLLIRVA
ncbi:hypothetical protein COX85_01595 [Candidatus Micrarchaeota archaeon CG_4_10_14_0_2_um_filter_55_9]|nr:MAG: hypothetical protein AUJ15_02225 [Candidatus Micrarchaeota archaeon CG1_02_55_41]PIO02855.1 MAG: hypothetical protein COT57_02160 [Candidatus Micrarchaeota archaeon CG09_land_8_20_14_0_10_55_25]PIZ91842.1 MAG: hypothetical protein COX85_01595 [Candidatus Micrarchaeota archaeon CG_4_10_14_0_2_um_filter_55_9]PJD01231.1 MAG: hypothetical protein COU38_02135 [Candidatus Micrarchaeota archaeon CG10_big_fil_rev_8_21_14_0_10_54_18]